MRYYVDVDGRYIGGSDGEPLSDFEVPSAPDDARQKWNGTSYDAPIQSPSERKEEIYQRLDEIDRLSIRALRSKGVGRGQSDDDTTLTALDDEADALRLELGAL